jgi:hypothetical protein
VAPYVLPEGVCVATTFAPGKTSPGEVVRCSAVTELFIPVTFPLIEAVVTPCAISPTVADSRSVKVSSKFFLIRFFGFLIRGKSILFVITLYDVYFKLFPNFVNNLVTLGYRLSRIRLRKPRKCDYLIF